MLGYVLISIACGFGCGESSHYYQFKTLQACDAQRQAYQTEMDANPSMEATVGQPAPKDHPAMARCVAGRTFEGGTRWTSSGVDWLNESMDSPLANGQRVFGWHAWAPDPFTSYEAQKLFGEEVNCKYDYPPNCKADVEKLAAIAAAP